jgi:hypothetical protein
MSDESSRSARPYGQRRNDGAPTWWAALERADLPEDSVVPAAHRRWYEDAHPVAPMVEVATSRAEPEPKRRLWLISVLVAVAVAMVLGIVWGGGDPSVPTDVVLTLLVAIPFGLAAVVTMLLVRRNS